MKSSEIMMIYIVFNGTFYRLHFDLTKADTKMFCQNKFLLFFNAEPGFG